MGLRMAALPLASLALLAQGPSGSTTTCNNTPAYSPCELVFELSASEAAAHPNPYGAVDLSVEFRSPRQRIYALPGYWDGGRRMVVRVAPVEAGEWNYRVNSNIAGWNGLEGSFTAAASDAPGFIRAAEMHHWAYTERNLPHLWMGVNELGFAAMDEAAFRALADAQAARKFNHWRGFALGQAPQAAYPSGAPDIAYFQKLDQRILYLNRKGIVADLILARQPSVLANMFPGWQQRRRFVRYLAARYAAMNVTWQGAAEFEDDPDGRALLKETGLVLKESDPYHHPRTSGARVTSAPLLDDGWMDFAAYGPGADDSAGAIEHQLYPAPFVNLDLGREDSLARQPEDNGIDAATLRHRLWNATMDGQYPTYENLRTGEEFTDSPGARAMTAWFNFMSATRHWELEPYFDVDGGRAVALEDTEYIVYIEKPGPLELQVEKHSYDVIWMNPATGDAVKEKKSFNGDHFTGEPPDRYHDWVLHLVRPGRLESMARTYRFESRLGPDDNPRSQPIAMQVIETDPAKVPFEIERPTSDLSLSIAVPYSVKTTKQTRATRRMMWLWTLEATSSGQGYRVLATGESGFFQTPASLARGLPATALLRLYGMNANGKVYELTKAGQITQ